MTFAAAGAWLFSNTAALTTNNQGTGNLLVVSVVSSVNLSVWATALSGGGVTTWTLAGTHVVGESTPLSLLYTITTFTGTTTATGAGTVTPTWSGTAPTGYTMAGHEFTSTAGTWTYDQQASVMGADNAGWPSLTPGSAGELYWGTCANNGTATAGATSGYTYNIDAAGDAQAFNPACTISVATSPAFTDTGAILALATLIKETGGTNATVVMGSAVTVTTAAPAPQTGSLTSVAYATAQVTNTVGGTGAWTSPGNATGAPDSAYATWAVV